MYESRFVRELQALGACSDAVAWCKNYGSLQEAWDKCERGDWMLWLASRLSGGTESPSRKTLVLAACKCARLALPYVRKGDKRPLKVIETAEAWARGENGVTLQDVRGCAYAADAAAYAAYAAYAADAADAAAYAADAAAYAAYAAAAYAAYAADARTKVRSQCAEIVREFYPAAPKMDGKKA